MTVEKTVTQPKESIVALAKRIADGLTLDTNTGIGSESKELYKELLPEELTMEQVKAVSEYNTDFIAAGAYAFGQMAVNAMSKNKDLTEASVDVNMGHRDVLKLSVDREKSYRNPLGGEGATSTKYGVVTAAYEVKSGKNGGQLKTARNAINAMALDLLK